MSEYYWTKDELYHHGIKGQKWGIRRWQNEDGSLTSAGREHYGYIGDIRNRKDYKNAIKGAKEAFNYNKKFIDQNYDGTKRDKKDLKRAEKQVYKEGLKEIKDSYKQTNDYKVRKAVAIGAAVVGTALVAYGAYKIKGNLDLKRFEKIAEENADKIFSLNEQKISELTKIASDIDKDTKATNKQLNEILKRSSSINRSYKVNDPLTQARLQANRRIANEIRTTGKSDAIENFIKKERAQDLVNKTIPRKSLKDFDFERAARVDANGKTSYIDLPVDKKGYADTFAKQMAESKSRVKPYNEEYSYWYNYIMKKIS